MSKNLTKMAGLLTLLSTIVTAGSVQARSIDTKVTLKSLNPDYRAPSSTVPADQTIVVPVRPRHWMEDLTVEDDKGVMQGMREQINEWDNHIEYARKWSLESTGLYEETTYTEEERYEQRSKFVRQQGLKYIDKRLSGEIKEAEEGTTLARVGKVQKALKPAGKVDIAPNYRLRVQAKLLQTRAVLKLENPFLDETEADVKMSSGRQRIDVNLAKKFATIGIDTRIHYIVHEDKWVASIVKPITNEISTSIESHQSDNTMMFSKNADSRFVVSYGRPF